MSGDPLKVLYCSFDVVPEPTGSSARATEFLRGLTAFNVDGLTAKSPDHPHIERYHGVRLMRVPVGGGDLPVRVQAFERAVRRQLESDEYHLVHFTDPYGGYALCELREQYSFKLLYEVVGFPSIEVKFTHPHIEGDRRFMAKLRRQELFCLMNADAVLVGSEVTASVVQGLGVSRERISVLPTPVDRAPYDDAQLPRPDRTPMRVVYLGSQTSWQGLSTLVLAAGIASQSCDLQVSIVGPQHPSWRLQLEEMIKFRGLSDRIVLLDAVPSDELPKVLATADVGVAPLEKSERNVAQGAPIAKIAHYLAAGRPVVASDLPIVREVVNPDCASLFNPGDENDMARCLVELANDPGRRTAMGEAGRVFVRERLSSERIRVELVKLYAKLLADLGEEIPIPEVSAAPAQSFSDAATCIGTMGPDAFAPLPSPEPTVTHVLRGAEGPTDPARRLGLPPERSDAFTDPGTLAAVEPYVAAHEGYSDPESAAPPEPAAKEEIASSPDSTRAGDERVSEAHLDAAARELAAEIRGARPFEEPLPQGELLQGELLQGDLLQDDLPFAEAPPAAPPPRAEAEPSRGSSAGAEPLPWEAILGVSPRHSDPPPSTLEELPEIPADEIEEAEAAGEIQPLEDAEPLPDAKRTPASFPPWEARAPAPTPAAPAAPSLPPIVRAPAPDVPTLRPPEVSASAMGAKPPVLGGQPSSRFPTSPPIIAASPSLSWNPAQGAGPGPSAQPAQPGLPSAPAPLARQQTGSPFGRQPVNPHSALPPTIRTPAGSAAPLPPILGGTGPRGGQAGAAGGPPSSIPTLDRVAPVRPPIVAAGQANTPQLGGPSSTVQPAQTGGLSPDSGSPASDEWLGHMLFGYAPFRVPLARRALTGEFQVTPIQRR